MTNAIKKQEKAVGMQEDEDPYHRLKLKKVIDAAMKKYTSLYTNNTVRSGLNNHIEQSICEKLSDWHTPDHPTYALMIRRAIEQLNEEKGSTEEAISKFIKEDVEDLPLAHASFLIHHLNKLSESGEIVKAYENCYMLPVENTSSLLKREGQVNGTEDRIESIEEQKPAEEQSEQDPQVNGTEDLMQAAEHFELLEEQIEQVQQLEVIVKHNEAKEHKVEFSEEKNQEQKGDSIDKPYQSRKQQNKEQDKVSSQQGQTQRLEIAVIVEEPSGAEEKNKVIGEEIQEKRVDGAILDRCLTKQQQSEMIEDQNLPHEHQIEDVKKQIQLQEDQILLIEKLIELQGQKNEVIEKQINSQTEVRSKIIGFSDLHFYKKPEKDEAIVTTQSSSLTSQRLENDGSLLPVKDKCIELLQRTRKIEEELMDIINSSCTEEVSKHDTLKPSIEEQENKNLKKPEQKQQIEFSNPRRLLEHEVETLQELFQKQKKQVQLCGQHEVPGCLPKPTGTSDVLTNSGELHDEQQQEHEDSEIGLEIGLKEIETKNVRQEESIPKNSLSMDSRQLEMTQLDFAEGQPELCSDQKLLESFPVMSSLEVPSELQALELEKKSELPYSESPLQLKSSGVEPSGQKEEQQQQATLCGKAKAHVYQIEQEWELKNPIQERPLELELTILERSCQRQQPSLGQQQWRKLQSQARRAFGDCVEANIPECQLGQEQQPRRQLRPRERLSEPVCMEAMACESQQELDSQGQGSQLRPRSQGVSQPELAVNNTTMELFSSKNQHKKQQQLKLKGRGRPSKLKPNWHMAVAEVLPSDGQHHHEQLLPKHKGWGRPPKSKEVLDPPTAHQNPNEHQKAECESQGRHPTPKAKADDQDHHEQQLQKHRGRGRPPKSMGVIDPTTLVSFPTAHQNQNEHQKAVCQIHGRHSTPEAKADTILQESRPLDHQNHNELQLQQPDKRGRGRPPKPKPVLATTVEASLPSQQQEQPQHRGQGRPPKRKLGTDSMMGEALTSGCQLQHPKRQRQGRPPKVDQRNLKTVTIVT